jgi:hypothetical protein
MGRQPRSTVPTTPDVLQPRTPDAVRLQDQSVKTSQAANCNRRHSTKTEGRGQLMTGSGLWTSTRRLSSPSCCRFACINYINYALRLVPSSDETVGFYGYTATATDDAINRSIYAVDDYEVPSTRTTTAASPAATSDAAAKHQPRTSATVARSTIKDKTPDADSHDALGTSKPRRPQRMNLWTNNRGTWSASGHDLHRTCWDSGTSWDSKGGCQHRPIVYCWLPLAYYERCSHLYAHRHAIFYIATRTKSVHFTMHRLSGVNLV